MSSSEIGRCERLAGRHVSRGLVATDPGKALD